MHVQIHQARRDDRRRARRAPPRRRGAESPRPTAGDLAVLDQHVRGLIETAARDRSPGRPAATGRDQLGPAPRLRGVGQVGACRRRAGTARPSARRRRSSPDRGSRCAGRRPRGSRSPRRGSSGPGCMMVMSRGACSEPLRRHAEDAVVLAQAEGMKPASIRSSCRRRTLSTSAHWIASSTCSNTVTPSSSTPRGNSVQGPQTATSAPSLRQAPDVGPRHARVEHVAHQTAP